MLYQSIQHVCVLLCAHVSDSSTWHELRHLDITNAHGDTKRHDLCFHNRWFPRRKRSVCLMCLGSDWGLHNLWIDRPALLCDEIVSFTFYGFTLYGFIIYWFTMTGYDREGGAPPFIVRYNYIITCDLHCHAIILLAFSIYSDIIIIITIIRHGILIFLLVMNYHCHISDLQTVYGLCRPRWPRKPRPPDSGSSGWSAAVDHVEPMNL